MLLSTLFFSSVIHPSKSVLLQPGRSLRDLMLRNRYRMQPIMRPISFVHTPCPETSQAVIREHVQHFIAESRVNQILAANNDT